MRKACIFLAALANLILFFNGCSKENTKMTIAKESFGSTPDGAAVNLYTLTSAGGIEVKITNYGGIITSLKTPDRDGNLDDIVLGYDTLAEYIEDTPYFGALIGRYGNRIAKGKFTLDGAEYTLAKNNGENHLHGGIKGFDKVVWTAEEIKDENSVGLKLKYLSKDGEEGYPGNLNCTVVYTLTDNDLIISYEAQTDKLTVINLTQTNLL
jgi:aldose 1-epimerase